MATALKTPVEKTTIERGGSPVSIAYRRHGLRRGIPLLLVIHYRANLHFWDPLLLEGLAAEREVVVFDLPGTGDSGGEVPTTYQGWADNVLLIADALNITQFDLAGFSMGGRCVQMVALTAPQRVRKLILLGTDASAPLSQSDEDKALRPATKSDPIRGLSTARTVAEMKRAIAYTFFYDTPVGRAAADAYWARVLKAADGDESKFVPLNEEQTRNQMASSKAWSTPGGTGSGSVEKLHQLKMPVLVLNGDDDVLIPTLRSILLVRGINATGALLPSGSDEERRAEAEREARKGAKLVLWPRAGHGFLWQFAEDVARCINDFLNDDGSWGVSARL